MKDTLDIVSSFPFSVVRAVQQVVGTGPVALHEPSLLGNEWKYLKECLDTGYVSSVGKFVDRFEAELAAYTGAGYAIALSNGTVALQVALQLAGVRAGDEVLVPSLSFIATANAVAYCSAQPHFVDSELDTLGMATVALREYLSDITDMQSGLCVNRQTGKVIRAMVPMHTFGHPVAVEELLRIAQDFGIVMVEDAAESLGSTIDGRHVGTFGRLAAVSFNGNKTVTTGGGGAILTSDRQLASRAKHLTTTAKIPHRWEYVHDEIGYNYRMPNINAALGCAQLEQIDNFIIAKRRLFTKYEKAFLNLENVTLFREPKGCQSNYWLQTLLLGSAVAGLRDAVLIATNDVGLMTRPVWKLLHLLAPYADAPRMELHVAETLAERIINLPSSAHLAGTTL